MKKIIDLVTVTGVTDHTKIGEMLAITQRYPFVEFGILLSKRSAGQSPRFPSFEYLKHLCDVFTQANSNPLRLAGHVCGEWVKEILHGYWPTEAFDQIHPELDKEGIFSRWQINTHAQGYLIDYPKLMMNVVGPRGLQKQTVIFQRDGVNDGLGDTMVKYGCQNVAGLFDLSHGAGIMPTAWPSPVAYSCGYAGGLSPKNVASVLAKLESVIDKSSTSTLWIDAETHLRSKDDSVFDLKKVMAFLEASKPWVK